MALRNSTPPDIQNREDLLLRRLLGLYGEEITIYDQILHLSRQQGVMIQQGQPIADIRKILEQKKNCLDIVSRLEATDKSAKREWDMGKQQWSVRGRARLHEVLGKVGNLIEEILIIEEDNDMQLIEHTRAC